MVRGGQTMTRKEVKNLLPILQAFTEGRVIQYRDNGVWKDITTEDGFYAEYAFVNVNDYRIKPELTYRPFANAEECWEEMQKHQPFGVVKDKMQPLCYRSFTTMNDNGCDFNGYIEADFDTEFGDITFADGATFGIKESED